MNSDPVQFLRVFLPAALITFTVGCGSDGKRAQVEVTGKIKFANGKPLPAGTTVILNPSEGGAGTASGKTDAGGSFKLTHVSGSNGAEVGKYTVKLRGPEGDAEFFKTVPKAVIDGDVLTADVQAGMGPLELTVPKPTPGKKGN